MRTIAPSDFMSWTQEERNAWFAQKPEPPARNGAAKSEAFLLQKPEANWTMLLSPASAIKPEPILWLWQGWLARGKMHIIAGQPGTGKTTIAMKMAAAVSARGRWPDGKVAKQGNVIIWSGEDDPADTLVPRLEASGADLTRVFFAGEVFCGKERRSFDPAKDIPALQAEIKRCGGASLIIVDPIVSATSADSHKNSETRRGLQPLVDMATRLNAALLGITHFTKGSEGRSPIDRVTGSVAFGALARVVMVAAREQNGDERRPGTHVLMRAKSNIGPDNGGFKYTLQSVPLRESPDIVASVVAWGDTVTGDARKILAAAEAEPADSEAKGTAFLEAKDWLSDFLLKEPKTAKEVQWAGREAGHSFATLRRAKEAICVKSVKNSLTGGWTWTLPSGKDSQRCSNPPHHQNDERLREAMSAFEETQDALSNEHLGRKQDAQGFCAKCR